MLLIQFLLFLHICHAELGKYFLNIHKPKDSATHGYTLADINFNTDTNNSNKISSEYQLYEYTTFKDDGNNGWCLSLIDTYSNIPVFTCFNYFKSFSSNKNNQLFGELAINLNSEGLTINGVSYYPIGRKEFSITLRKNFKLIDPQVRLTLKPSHVNEMADIQIDSQLIDFVTEDKDKKEEKKKLMKNQVEIDDYNDKMKEFQEIVKPRGLYSKNKTFIEQYWIYIVPPAVIIFVVGNLIIGN
jgi:hypothetical protein